MVSHILSTYAVRNNASNLHLSIPGQNADEEGPAAATDDAAFTEDRDAGYATLDGAKYYSFSYTKVSAAVVAQTSLPAVFAVVAREVTSPGTPTADRNSCHVLNLFVFRRDSRTAPWRVEFEPTVPSDAHLPPFITGVGGFASFAGGRTSYKLPLTQVDATYAGALGAYARSGTLSYGLTPSMFSATCGMIPNLHSDEETLAQRGLRATFSFAASGATYQEAWKVRGGALVALNISGMERLASTTPGGTIAAGGIAGHPSSFEVAAGTYRSITVPIDEELVVFDPASDAAGSPRPVGSDMGLLLGTATP